MKKLIAIFLLLFNIVNCGLIAQKTNEGVYLSVNDFMAGKTSYVDNHQTGKYKLCVNKLFCPATIKIIKGDSIIRLSKNSVFGYRDKRSNFYRFYKRITYKILNPGEKILLYTSTAMAGVPKNIHLVTTWYFSENAGSPVYPLTRKNLKTVLYKEVALHTLLDVYFSSDNELSASDLLNKKYMLNRVYDESKQTLCRINENK